MHRLMRSVGLVVAAALLGLGADRVAARIPSVGGLLKGGGIIIAVRQFGGEIDRAINGLLNQRGLAYTHATKVVPIVSVGRGIYVGAAQVVGSRTQVDRVRGVAQVETRLGDLEGNLLLPTNTLTPTKDVRKIQGVGVGALIDFTL